MNIGSRKRNWYLIILFIISCLSILLYLHVATTFDEKYTLLLASHKFSHLIYFDSLDVHPPLYYIILRYFLIITTFWTTLIPIKIIFARLLSLIFSIVMVVYIYKTFELFGLNVRFGYQWILFILLPNVLCSYNPYNLQPLINIRMYSLAAMIIAVEFYYLNKISKNSNIKLYVTVAILSGLAMCTHYFAAFITVIMIITFIIKFRHNKSVVKRLFLSLIISCLLYLPWLPYFYRRISIPKLETFNMGRFGTLAHIVLFIIICIILSYHIIWAKRHLNNKINILSYEIVGTLGLTLFFISAILLIIRPMFNLRYIYPIFIIYELYCFDILFGYMMHKIKLAKICAVLISILLFANISWSSYYQLSDIDIPDFKINKNIFNIAISNKQNICLNSKYSRTSLNSTVLGKNHQFEIDKTPINFEYAFLLSNYHKNIFAKNLHNYFAINKKPAYKPIFKNIYMHIYK